MSAYIVTNHLTGASKRVEVPEKVQVLPAHQLFAWLMREVERRETIFPLPTIPGTVEVILP